MNTSTVFFTLLFGVIIFVTETSARPDHRLFDSPSYNEGREEDLSLIGKDRDYNRREHRTRHSRQIGIRYDYSPWFYEKSNPQILQQVKNNGQLLDEILKIERHNSYSQPKPIFIPIPIYLPCHDAKISGSDLKKYILPNLNNRFGDDIDSDGLIWGVEQADNAVEDDNDGARPISFKPIKVNSPQGLPSPPIEHGSVQAGVTTAAPLNINETPANAPGICEAAILSCCRFKDLNQERCFKQYGCILTYKTGIACSETAIKAVITRFKDMYGPR